MLSSLIGIMVIPLPNLSGLHLKVDATPMVVHPEKIDFRRFV